MGVISTPYCGLPRKTICSHLIMPNTLFFRTTTFTGRRYWTQVANSAMSISMPPSPTNATHCRPGWATWAAIAYGSPLAIEARVPLSEKRWPRRMRCR